MKKLITVLLSLAAILGIMGCGAANETEPAAQRAGQTASSAGEGIKINITVNGKTLTAVLEDNPTTQALVQKLPLTLPMLNLYGREMCYRFDEALPTGALTSESYEVGDLAYWPPRHSFVILYKQNGEHFERQHLGRITSGDVNVFGSGADMEVTLTGAE